MQQSTVSFAVSSIRSSDSTYYESLEGIDANNVGEGATCRVAENDSLYWWDPSCTNPGDYSNYVKPSNFASSQSGRWRLFSLGGASPEYYQSISVTPVDGSEFDLASAPKLHLANVYGSNALGETIVTFSYQRLSTCLDGEGICARTQRPILRIEGTSEVFSLVDDPASNSSVLMLNRQKTLVYSNDEIEEVQRTGLNFVGLPADDDSPTITDDLDNDCKKVHLYYQKIQEDGEDVASALRLNFDGACSVVTEGGVTTVSVATSYEVGLQTVYAFNGPSGEVTVAGRTNLDFKNGHVVDLGAIEDAAQVTLFYQVIRNSEEEVAQRRALAIGGTGLSLQDDEENDITTLYCAGTYAVNATVDGGHGVYSSKTENVLTFKSVYSSDGTVIVQSDEDSINLKSTAVAVPSVSEPAAYTYNPDSEVFSWVHWSEIAKEPTARLSDTISGEASETVTLATIPENSMVTIGIFILQIKEGGGTFMNLIKKTVDVVRDSGGQAQLTDVDIVDESGNIEGMEITFSAAVEGTYSVTMDNANAGDCRYKILTYVSSEVLP